MTSITVIIPALDEAALIESAVASVVAQMRPGDEVVVVDGGSRDGTAEVASRGARVIAGERPRSRQSNQGARRAGGEALLFLHADSRLPGGALDRVRDALADPRVAAGCFPIGFAAAEVRHAPLLAWVARGINARSLALRQGTGDQGLFARSAVFRALGGFREWPLMEDLDFCRRVKRLGTFRVLPGAPLETSARRWLRRGVVRTQLGMWAFRVAYALGVPPETLGRHYAAIR
ncbi:MAG: TIGR04283 family arsenosugar biosynthesis glycosyltransferase [Gemmatimonadetes bacterium]|nr:TIGR04283 family arsenosugar biosynthesis glycosyltransferase [Gemmatimonadota bacterium]